MDLCQLQQVNKNTLFLERYDRLVSCYFLPFPITTQLFLCKFTEASNKKLESQVYTNHIHFCVAQIMQSTFKLINVPFTGKSK